MSRRPVALVALLLALTPVLVACAGQEEAGPVCGGARTVRIGTTTWICTFDEEFDGTTLDRSRWEVQKTAASGWTTGATCYLDHPGVIGVSGGALHLVARRNDRPLWCGRLHTADVGGAVMTKGHFAQTRGLFVVRARFPATRLPGFWGDLWLYPEELTYGAWPGSGEIDIAEHWSGHGDDVSASLHYAGSSGADSRACRVPVVSAFHTYAVQWDESTMTFFYDGHPCFTRDWTATTGSTRPFDKPFFVMLSEGIGDFNLPVSPALPRAGAVDVDYVRVYR